MLATQSPEATIPATRDRAVRWFADSGIQGLNGGVSRYYRGDIRQRLPNSVEITGYAVSGLLHLGLFDEARRAGDFIIDRAWDARLGVFPFELDSANRFSYFFDNGMVARGLLRLFEVTGDERYQCGAVNAADSMKNHFEAEGGYHPILQLPDRTPLSYQEWWSRRPGCFQLKAALAWRQLGGEYLAGYHRQLMFSLTTVEELLSIERIPVKIMDRLHPYCYFLEGLMPVAEHYPGVMDCGIDTVAKHLRSLAPKFCRSDVYSQLLRVRLLADKTGVVKLDEAAAAEEARAIETFQIESEDPWLNGSFAFGRIDGDLVLHANPVSTIFAIQALDWWQQFLDGRFAGTWTTLI